jgi:putative ABC transport system ATP-binding protein
MAQEPFIICDNLVKIYKIADLETVALQGLDLVVAPGELMGIVGPSGSGKSTLMNIVGFVWQQSSRNLVPYLSALENVELPMTLAGQNGKKRRHATELLEAVGLAERRNHHLAQLSGGEQQRVAIAVSLANRPALLLADEPTGEVDSTTALTIYETFQQLNREYGLTTLIVSHDPGIARHVDRVVAIRDGKTATETVRQSARTGAPNGEVDVEDEFHEEDIFEELVVLDSAGRLQVPKEYLEYLDIKGRARLELTEDGVLIRPAPEAAQAQMAETAAAEMVPEASDRGLRGLSWAKRVFSASRSGGWLGRFGRKREQE